jgi:TonB family protein
MALHRTARTALLLCTWLLATAALAQKRGSKGSPVDSIPYWVQRAAELERLADNAGAEANFSKAYYWSGNTELLMDRARVLRNLGDSVGACRDLANCQRFGDHWKDQYQRQCVRKDSTAIATSGLDPAAHPGIVAVTRVRRVDEEATYLALYDATDTVRQELVVVGGDTAFLTSATPPQFPGGEQALYKHLQQNIHYPEVARELGFQGKVFMQFVIGSDGRTRHVRVKRSVHPLLDAEAARVIGTMPAWTPAQHEGRAVAYQYILPFNFTLR